MELRNKVVLVTGSSSGIGKAIALKFSEYGSKVVITSKSNIDGGKKVAEDIIMNKGEAIYIQADLSNENDVRILFKEIVKEFNTIDVLINNAGRTIPMPFIESTKEHWIEAFETNLISTVLCSIEAVKIMKNNKISKIINTSSVRGLDNTGREGIMAYSAAKAAVNNFTKTLAKELSPNILVNAVAPGFVQSPYMDTVTDEQKNNWLANIPIKRFIMPSDLAEAYIYLAESDFMTGEILIADGGFTLKFA